MNQFLEKFSMAFLHLRCTTQVRSVAMTLVALWSVTGLLEAQPCPGGLADAKGSGTPATMVANCCRPDEYGVTVADDTINLVTCASGSQNVAVQAGGVYRFVLGTAPSYSFDICYPTGTTPVPQFDIWSGLSTTDSLLYASVQVVNGTQTCQRVTFTDCDNDVFLSVYKHSCVRDWTPFTLRVTCNSCTLNQPQDQFWSANGADCDADNRTLPVPIFCADTLPITWNYNIINTMGDSVAFGTYTNEMPLPIVNNLMIGYYQVTFNATAAGNPSLCADLFPKQSIYRITVLPVMACDDLVNVSLAAGCSAVITPEMLLEDLCIDTTSSEINDIEYVVNVNNTGSNTVTSANVGQTLSTTIGVYVDVNGNNRRDAGEAILNSCWGFIKVEDKYGPIINCGKSTVFCGQPTSVAALGAPGVIDECSSVASLTHTDTEVSFSTCSDDDGDGIFFPPHAGDMSSEATLDNDGVDSDIDPDNDGDGMLDAVDPDDDNDGIADDLDPDDDNDGILDGADMDDSNCDGIDDDRDGMAWTKIISRAWTATDLYGNVGTCTQTIFVARPLLSALDALGQPIPVPGKPLVYIEFPESLDGVEDDPLYCDNPSITYDANGHPIIPTDTSGVPQIVVVRENGVAGPVGDITTRLDINSTCLMGYTYVDQFIPICEKSWKIARLWTVLDWCNTNNQQVYSNVNDLQIIKIVDTLAPIFICPTAAQVQITYNNSLNCSGRVVLPAVTATDNCSSTANLVYSVSAPGLGTLNTNGGIFNNVPIGTHVFTYSVADNCGNVRRCSLSVTLVDQIEPTAVCEQTRVVSVPNGGNAIVFAQSFDDGSYDNCGVTTYQVRRLTPGCGQPGGSTAPFTDHVEFCCEDVNAAGTPVMVELRVCDAAGNCNSCMVNVVVQDKINPVITCPTTTTATCGPDYENYTNDQLNAAFGVATATDNCSVDITVTNTPNINQCGTGTITRVWTAVDPGGRTATCTQVINIVNADPFTAADITWPTAEVTRGCGDDFSPASTGRPTFAQDGPCDQVAFGYDDLILTVVQNACFKIIRTWTVIDWCQYNNETGAGRWTRTQTIKVMDTVAPEITGVPTSPQTISVEANCRVDYVIPTVTATDACDILINSGNPATTISVTITGINGTVFPTVTNDYTHNLARGTYRICYNADDRCGNRTTACYTLNVQDIKKPTPVCIFGLAAPLMQTGPTTGMVEIWASDFESGSSFDNCSAYEDLTFFINRVPQSGVPFQTVPSTTSVTFDCTDIGTQTVQLWVCDEAGNCDYCITAISIQNNVGIDCGNTEGNIAGAIQTEAGDNVEAVTVTVSNTNTTMPSTTNANGWYGIPNLPMNQNYTVTPVKDMNTLNGVTTFDLVLISKHILGIATLDTPYKLIAADVNKSKTITTLDLVQLRQLILHITEEFPNNTSWRFVDKNYQFQDPTNAHAEIFPEIYNIDDLNGSMTVNFTGVKIGDVNGSAVANTLLGVEDRNANGQLTFKVENQQLAAGNTYQVTFNANDFQQVIGYQFTMAFDNNAIEVLDLTPEQLAGLTAANFGTQRIEEGIITTSWNADQYTSLKEGTPVFTLTIRAKQNVELRNVLNINSTYTAAEAYAKGTDLMDVKLDFNGAAATTVDYALYQNQPNPFKGETTIRFSLPTAAYAKLTIVDVAGKVLKIVDGDFTKGMNEVRINKADLQTTGVVYYRLETDNYTATKKMLLIE